MKRLYTFSRLIVVVAGWLYCTTLAAQPVTITASHLDLDSLGSDSVACTFIVSLSDTAGVSQLEIALGHSPGDTSLVYHVFDYDVSTGLPAGFGWQREGKRIEMATGSVIRHPTWFGRVRVKDNLNVWSQPKMFVRN